MCTSGFFGSWSSYLEKYRYISWYWHGKSKPLARNISSSLCQKPEMKLSKGSYFHSSFACMASRSHFERFSAQFFAHNRPIAGLKCWASLHFFLPFEGLWSKVNIWKYLKAALCFVSDCLKWWNECDSLRHRSMSLAPCLVSRSSLDHCHIRRNSCCLWQREMKTTRSHTCEKTALHHCCVISWVSVVMVKFLSLESIASPVWAFLFGPW